MNSLYILTETYTNGYRTEILDLISLIAIICGIFVIITKNPIISVLFLIGLFLSISGYLILLGINFIGISYILVYVGAVSILFIFILISNTWEGNIAETTHITTIGSIIYTNYSIWIMITSIILLLAMVGAIVITIKQKKRISSMVEPPFYTR